MGKLPRRNRIICSGTDTCVLEFLDNVVIESDQRKSGAESGCSHLE